MTLDRKDEVVEFLRGRLAERLELPIDSISIQSDLIELGLQSIDAVLISEEVENRFQIELDPSTVFQHDDLAGFAAEVTSRLAPK